MLQAKEHRLINDAQPTAPRSWKSDILPSPWHRCKHRLGGSRRSSLSCSPLGPTNAHLGWVGGWSNRGLLRQLQWTCFLRSPAPIHPLFLSEGWVTKTSGAETVTVSCGRTGCPPAGLYWRGRAIAAHAPPLPCKCSRLCSLNCYPSATYNFIMNVSHTEIRIFYTLSFSLNNVS